MTSGNTRLGFTEPALRTKTGATRAAAGLVLACILALASYGAYQTFWGKSTPQTLAGAVPCPGQILAQCSDASAAINTAISIALSRGIPLYIDQPYRVDHEVLLVSGLTISAAAGACFIQNTGTNPVVGNTGQVSNVTAQNLQICVNPNNALGGDGYQLNVINSRFYNPTIRYAALPGASPPTPRGNAFTVTSINSQFYGASFSGYCSGCSPAAVTAAVGGFVWQGCTDSQVIGGFGISQGGTWQFAPVATSTGIVRCRFENVGGQSNGAEFFVASLPAGAGSKAASAYPNSHLGTGSNYANNDTLTASGGTCTTEPTFTVTQNFAGAVTQVTLKVAGQCSVPPTNPVATTTSGSGSGAQLNISWVNADATANCIIDSGISGAPGQTASGRGLTVSNQGSSGGQCPGRPPIDGLTVSNVTLDDSADQQSTQTISISGADSAHPVGAVTFDSVSVPSPYTACADVSGPVRSVVFNHPDCGRSHLGLVGYLTTTAVTGATTLTVATPQCAIIGSGDLLGIVLDDNAAANGSYAGKQQIVSTTGCSSGNIGLGTGLLGTASGATAGSLLCCVGAVFDYSEQVYNITAPTTLGNPCNVTLQSTANISVNDSVWLVLDSNAVISTTVQTVNSPTTLTLSQCASGQASAGNLFVDRSKTSSHPMFTTEGVRGIVLNQPVIRGANSSVLSLGPSPGSPAPSADVAINDARLLDIASGVAGIQYSNCDFCPMKGGSVTATAGSISSYIASFSTAPPSGTDYVAAAINASQTTLSTENPSLFNYVHSFYALIDSEIVLVQAGMGTPSWTIARGQLHTTQASHNVGAAITIAQSGATDSPIVNVDAGDLGVTNPSLTVSNYQPGQGNDIQSLQGVDWQAAPLPAVPVLPFSDAFPQINFTSGASIAQVTYSSSMPPFKTKCQRWYNATPLAITVANGSGIHNTGGAAFSLTSHGYGEWCLDPGQRAFYQLGGSAN